MADITAADGASAIDFAGRTAFITGGAQGIGLGIARRLARAEVKLALADIDEAALATAAAELKKTTEVETYALDVRDRALFATVADEVEAKLGPVSLLFNNAGIAGGVQLDRMTYEMWDWVLDINLGGVVNGIQTFLPRMIERGDRGHVVNTSSGAGIVPTQAGFLYATSKYAVVGMSEVIRQELQQARIPIGMSVLCPGPVATGIVKHTRDRLPEGARRSNPEAMDEIETVKHALDHGVHIDEVGEMVFRAIAGNRLYIFTDQIVADATVERAQAILAEMPPDPDAEPDEPTAQSPSPGAGLGKRRKLKGFTVEVDLPAPPADVYAIVGNPARVGEWNSSHGGFPDGLPAELVPGAGFRQTVLSASGSAEIAWVVTEATAPKVFEIEGKGMMGIRMRTRYELAARGEGTVLAVSMAMGGGPLAGPLGNAARESVREGMDESLRMLSGLLAR
jgi:NAD(P)-dependent dehydrogenase (short-subunit alcohol dehydrogenase family)/uncharacterized protein YndB with AHSA1/START domain